MANEFDIAKLITLSTAHITDKTSVLLDKEWKENNFQIAVYDKNGYGFFIYISEGTKEKAFDDSSDLPKDLKDCIKFAVEKECEWLCLDCDAEPIDELPKYDW